MIKKFFSRGYVFLVLAFVYIPIFILIIKIKKHYTNNAIAISCYEPGQDRKVAALSEFAMCADFLFL